MGFQIASPVDPEKKNRTSNQRATGLICARPALLLLEIDLFVGVLCDAGTDLCGRLSGLGHGVGVEGFLRAGGALRTVQTLVATAQAGMSQGPVASAIAGELIEHVTDFPGLLVDVDLPGVAEILTGQFRARQHGGKRGDLERSRRVVRRHIVGGVRKLCIADGGYREDGEA